MEMSRGRRRLTDGDDRKNQLSSVTPPLADVTHVVPSSLESFSRDSPSKLLQVRGLLAPRRLRFRTIFS